MFISEIQPVNKPEVKTTFHKIGEWSATGVIWAIWIYLITPLMNLLLWLLGGYYFHRNAIANGEYRHLLDLLGSMGLWALIVFVILRTWGFYNYRRFYRKNQRIKKPQSTLHELSAVSNLSTARLSRLQRQKEVRWDTAPTLKALTPAMAKQARRQRL